MDSLEDMRNRVKKTDEELVRLLRSRMDLTDNIAPIKKSMGMAVYDPETEDRVINRARELAAELKVSPSMIETIMRTIMAESRLRQDSESHDTENFNIAYARYLPPPMEFKAAIPLSEEAARTVGGARNSIRNILDRKDTRKILIVGPCSIHDTEQAEEYAMRLSGLQEKVHDKFLLIMRTYVEKSRSGIGWTGFLTDPRLDGSGDVQEGITMTRKLLNKLGEMGVPTAVEFINPLVASYIGDLVSWAAIGARSSGSQIHRDMASGLEMPVGFKNGLDGNIDPAIGAVKSAGQAHDYLGLDHTGSIAAFKTNGNKYCHPVLRGGEVPNYDEKSMASVLEAMKIASIRQTVMVDCSHGNSGKVAQNQIEVFNNLIGQIVCGNNHIIGLMLESNLEEGCQPLPENVSVSNLKYGISITDECLGWETTEKIILAAYDRME